MVSEMVVSSCQVSVVVLWKVSFMLVLAEKMPSIVTPTSWVISVPNIVEMDLSMPILDVIVLDWSASALMTA